MDRNGRLTRAAAWTGIGSLAIAAAHLMNVGQPENGAVLVVFAAIAVALIRFPRWVPTAHTLVFMAVALLDAAAFVFGLFDRLAFADEVAHCLTTLAVTLTAGDAVYRPLGREFRTAPVLLLLATASFGLSVGAAWEIYEYAVGLVGTVGDTIWDLIWDAVGAACAALVIARRKGLGQRRPLPRFGAAMRRPAAVALQISPRAFIEE